MKFEKIQLLINVSKQKDLFDFKYLIHRYMTVMTMLFPYWPD